MPLKKGKRPMRRIGLNIRSVKRPSPDVIKIMNAHRVSLEGFRGSDGPDVVLRPNPALVAKRLDFGFHRSAKRPAPDVIKIMNAHRALEGFRGGDVPDGVL